MINLILDIEAIKARLQAATPGPWIAVGAKVQTLSEPYKTVAIGKHGNASFIANTPMLLQACVAEIEKLNHISDNTVLIVSGEVIQVPIN